MDSFDIDLNQILNRHEKWIKLYNKNICNCLACKIIMI